MTDWIPVKDRLPPISENIWLSGCDIFTFVTIGVRETGGRHRGFERWSDSLNCDIDGNHNEVFGVTHWMPFEMPEPPANVG